jgi:hypothetical protein
LLGVAGASVLEELIDGNSRRRVGGESGLNNNANEDEQDRGGRLDGFDFA